MKLGTSKKAKGDYLGVDHCSIPGGMVVPYCSHGPTLLFKRFLKNRPPRKFFACAVFRTKKGCPFFQWSDIPMNRKTQTAYLQSYKKSREKYKWRNLRKRLLAFINYENDENRSLCITCGTLLLKEEIVDHQNHILKQQIAVQDLLSPSRLFPPLSDRHSLAQEFFTAATLKVINANISHLGFSHVISVGTPTLHECILNKFSPELSTFLLDLDPKYSQFFNPNLYQRFNLFNTHFFSRKGSVKLRNFVSSVHLSKVLIVLDLPFGAKVEVIYSGLRRLWKIIGWRASTLPQGVPTLWIFPYFNGSEIAEKTAFKMVQYRIEYEVKYSKNHRGSPIRMFSNIPLEKFKLPTDTGEYRRCEECNKFVFADALHCIVCDACVSADGGRYHHCDFCYKCVKESFRHCDHCHVCHPFDAECLTAEQVRKRCHICKDKHHKRMDCLVQL